MNYFLHILFSLEPIKLAFCFILFFYLAYRFQKNYDWIFPVIFALAGLLVFASLTTAAGFIPDDWSACRIAVPLALLNEQHLYSDLNNNPANCFFYLPAGAWMYLPAAAIGKIAHSVSLCLIAGWSETIILYFLPILILLARSTRPRIEKTYFLLIAIILTFATASLRYVATMIHVDAIGISLSGCAVAMLIPGRTLVSLNRYFVALSGSLLALSLLTKQTFWPPIILLFLMLLWLISKNHRWCYLISFSITAISLLLLTATLENPHFFWLFAVQSASHVPQVASFSKSIQTFFLVNYPVFVPAILVIGGVVLGGIKSFRIEKGWWVLIFISFLSSPLGIYSYTKAGADVNHFAFSSYFLLFSLILFFLISELHARPPEMFFSGLIILISFFSLASYLKLNCGPYLWMNNPHQIAFEYQKKHGSNEIYFPWQPVGSLLLNNSFHLDPGLRFESINSTGKRSDSNLCNFLPPGNFKIAVRPYGAPSYLVELLHAKVSSEAIPELPGWTIYETKGILNRD